MSDLFRREAVAHATRRLDGQVVLATPLSVSTLGLLLAVVVFTATIFAALGTYSRKATVTGYLIPDQGMIRAASPAAATLQSIMVREGDIVAAGDRIAVLSVSTETTGGNVGDIISQGLTSETRAGRVKAESRLAQLEVEREQANIRLSKSEAEHRQILRRSLYRHSAWRSPAPSTNEASISPRKASLPGGRSMRAVSPRLAPSRSLPPIIASLRRPKAPLRTSRRVLHRYRSRSTPRARRRPPRRRRSISAAPKQKRAGFSSSPRRWVAVSPPCPSRRAVRRRGRYDRIVVPVGGQLEAELLAPSRSIGFIKPGRMS